MSTIQNAEALVERSGYQDTATMAQIRSAHEEYWSEVWSRYSEAERKQAQSMLFDFDPERVQQFELELLENAKRIAEKRKQARLAKLAEESAIEERNRQIIQEREQIIRSEIVAVLEEQKRHEEKERRERIALNRRLGPSRVEASKLKQKKLRAERKARAAKERKRLHRETMARLKAERELAKLEAKKKRLQVLEEKRKRFEAEKIAKIELKLAKEEEKERKRRERQRKKPTLASQRRRKQDKQLVADCLASVAIKLLNVVNKIRDEQ